MRNSRPKEEDENEDKDLLEIPMSEMLDEEEDEGPEIEDAEEKDL